MTTAYTENKSPRLPDNYPDHVERILAKRASAEKWRKASSVIIECLSWLLVFVIGVAIGAILGFFS